LVLGDNFFEIKEEIIEQSSLLILGGNGIAD
jgi:hypothetical protein